MKVKAETAAKSTVTERKYSSKIEQMFNDFCMRVLSSKSGKNRLKISTVGGASGSWNRCFWSGRKRCPAQPSQKKMP